MSLISVNEAARRLGASPAWVRKKAGEGQLGAHRLGREWAIDEFALGHVRRGEKGRPISPRAAWLALFAMHGSPSALEPVSRVERQRARRRAELISARGLQDIDLSRRAVLCRFRGTPVQVTRLVGDQRVVRSGISAASDVRSDLLDSAREFEGYVSARDLDELMVELRLEAAPMGEHGRILLRVPKPEWPFAPGATVAPWTVVAADLSESRDPRTKAAAEALVGDA
jgi:excisionase family DNA binding protein